MNAPTNSVTSEIPDQKIVDVTTEKYVRLFILTALIGVGAGLGAIFFRWLIQYCTLFFSGYSDYSDQHHAAHPYITWLGPYFVLFTPIIAGLIYGPLVAKFAPEAKGHGVPEVMLAVAERGGRIPGRVAIVKACASALTIGSGGSVGREGPIVQIGSALGSAIAQWFKVREEHIRLLVACGAAGGIAATFNAPLSGPIFAGELILREFRPLTFTATCISALIACFIPRSIFGDKPFITVPSFSIHAPSHYVAIIVLAVIAGLMGWLFSLVLYRVEDICDALWKGPQWLRPAGMGLLVGIVLLILPETYGVGYPVLQNAILGHYAIGMLLVLLVGKMLATSLTIGVGGSGGVFAPTLFIGAMAGTAVGAIGHQLWPTIIVHPGMLGLLGMGAAFAGATLAPVTGIIIVTELTGEFNLLLPLMIAVTIATIISRRISKFSIYTLKLQRRGIDLGD